MRRSHVHKKNSTALDHNPITGKTTDPSDRTETEEARDVLLDLFRNSGGAEVHIRATVNRVWAKVGRNTKYGVPYHVNDYQRCVEDAINKYNLESKQKHESGDDDKRN